MRNILIMTTLIAIGSMISCSSNRLYPKYEDSNPVVIAKLVHNLGVGAYLKKYVQPGSRISIASIERTKTIDTSYIAIVEDNIINDCINSGVKIIERDSNAIRILENKAKPTTTDDDSSVVAIENADSDAILFYRIYELGVIYRSIDIKHQLSREARAVIHLRLVNRRTGDILDSRSISKSYLDTIPEQFQERYENFHYILHPPALPLSPTKENIGKGDIHTGSSADESSNYIVEAQLGMLYGVKLGWGNEKYGYISILTQGGKDPDHSDIGFGHQIYMEHPLHVSDNISLLPGVGVGANIGVGFGAYWKVNDRIQIGCLGNFGLDYGVDESLNYWTALFGLRTTI